MGSRLPVDWHQISTSIINPQPLIVTADTPVMTVLEQMSHLHGASCTFPANSEEMFLQVSCAIVTDAAGHLMGVFTERDLVKLMVEAHPIEQAVIGEVLSDSPITISPEQCHDISAPLYLMKKARIQHLPVVDHQSKVLGIVTLETLCQAIAATQFLQLWPVQAVMTPEFVCATPSMSILEVACQMYAHHTSCVVVTGHQPHSNQPIGIITECDILQLQTLGIPTATTFAEQVMSRPLFLVAPSDSLWSVYQQMHHHHIRRMVVVDDHECLLGIVNQDDLLQLFAPLANHALTESLPEQVKQLKEEIREKARTEAEFNQKIEQERLLRLITQEIQ